MADARAGSDADSAPAYGGERDDHDDRGDFADDAVPPPGPGPSGWRQRLLSMAGKPADIAAAAPGLTGLMAARRARKAAKKAKRSAGASETKEEFATHSAMPRAVRRYEHPRGTAIAKRTRDGSERQTRHVSIDLEAMRANGMLTLDEERSVIAEEFRLVKRPLLLRAFAEGEDRIRHGNLIMVSSGRPGEGKTFCSVNLAMSIALERDLTVMLIDADVAKPSVPSVLGFEAELGLIDLIADDGLDVADVLVRTDIENLTILPAGRPHHLATELLASERMEQLIVELAERYPDRVIIIDSSPVLMSSIPGVLALYVGQIVFVVQAEKSTQSSIDAALGLISACENIYLLLNKTRSIGGAEKFGAYYGYYR